MIRGPGLVLYFEVKGSLCPVPFWNVSPQCLRDEIPGSQAAETTMQSLPLPLNCVTVGKWHDLSGPVLPLFSNVASIITTFIIFMFITIYTHTVVVV